MSLDPRDPKLTARLESALCFLTKNSDVSIGYLTRRYALEEGALQLWLDTFNGGEKTLTVARIAEVKTEIGALSVGKNDRPAPVAPPAPVAAPAPASPAPVPTVRVKRAYTRRIPVGMAAPTAVLPPISAPSMAPIVVNDPMAMTLVAANKSLGELIASQLNQSLAAFRYEVDVRLVPVAPKSPVS